MSVVSAYGSMKTDISIHGETFPQKLLRSRSFWGVLRQRWEWAGIPNDWED